MKADDLVIKGQAGGDVVFLLGLGGHFVEVIRGGGHLLLLEQRVKMGKDLLDLHGVDLRFELLLFMHIIVILQRRVNAGMQKAVHRMACQ